MSRRDLLGLLAIVVFALATRSGNTHASEDHAKEPIGCNSAYVQ